MKKNEQVVEANCIWGAHAAKIFGVSKPTFEKRVSEGRYKLRSKRCSLGFKYSIYDVFKAAHPRLNDRQIEEFIRDYREKRTSQKRAYKKRGSK